MRKKPFYGWVICVLCMILHFFACGMTQLGISAHYPFFQESFGLTNTQISMITTVRSLAALLAITMATRYYEKLSLRLGITVTMVLMSVGNLIYGFSSRPLHFYAAAAIMGVVFALGATIPITILLRNWFIGQRSTAIGFSMCGAGVCAIVVPPAATALVTAVGLRAAFLLYTAVTALLAAALFLLLRDKPEDMGLEAYPAAEEPAESQAARPGFRGVTHSEMLLLYGVSFLVGGVASSCPLNLSIYYTAVGIPEVTAAFLLSLYGIVLTCGKVSYGILSNRFGTYRANFLYLTGWLASCVLYALLRPGASIALSYAASLLLGVGMAASTVGVTLWIGELSSAEDYGKNIQWSQTIFALGGLLVSILPGIIADTTGSYAGSYALFAVMLVPVFFVVQRDYHKYRKELQK